MTSFRFLRARDWNVQGAGITLAEYVEQLAVGGRTRRAFHTAIRRLEGFYGKDVRLAGIDGRAMEDFQRHLLGEGLKKNTVSFYLRMLRAIRNRAIAEGIVSRSEPNPFANVYIGTEATTKRALNANELGRLAGVEGSRDTDLSPPLTDALALFLFCYHARGMCFVDLAYLRKSDWQGNVIRYRRRKTGRRIEVSVQPAMRRILGLFAGRVRGSDYLFPIITDPLRDHRLQYENALRVQNRRLKRLSRLVGLDKTISTHVARHSWATIAKSKGLPIAVISECLGHSDQKTTEIYLGSLERSALERASRMVSEAIIPKATKPTKQGKFVEGEVPR